MSRRRRHRDYSPDHWRCGEWPYDNRGDSLEDPASVFVTAIAVVVGFVVLGILTG